MLAGRRRALASAVILCVATAFAALSGAGSAAGSAGSAASAGSGRTGEKAAATTTAATDATTVTLDGRDSGKVFDGVGAVSAGGSSRLLVDYPEPERSQILDYLFRPNYGASLQLLKIEIGGDVDATDGAEPSHERVRGQLRCDLGYEWWLAREAKKRNPDLKLYALAWGAPGWFDGGMWSSDHVAYLIDWLDCAKRNGLTIDYLGGANERGYTADFYIGLRGALDAHGYKGVRVVATDEHHPPDYFTVAHDMVKDPAFAASADILGEHDVCVWRTDQQHCHANDDARSFGKPLWDSENSTQDADIGAAPLARVMNRHYLDVGITGNLNWALLAAWYDNYPIGGTGLMTAERPWSGAYTVGPEIWVDAQTTQFTKPGWRYLDHASGYLDNGASYVSLRSPASGDHTTVIETMDATGPAVVRLQVTGGLSTAPMNVWSTNVRTLGTDDDFVRGATLQARDGAYELTVRPGRIYTVSTTTGQRKANARSGASVGAQLRLPYKENFDELAPAKLARYVSDVIGGFESVRCGGGRSGMCYRQMVTQKPIDWGGVTIPPTTLTGDPRWWGDYEVGADVLLEGADAVELLGRVDSQQHRAAGYHFRLASKGDWSLTTLDASGRSTTLLSGTTSPPGAGTWHRMAMSFTGESITVRLDGKPLGSTTDASHTTGQVGFAVGGWQTAQFDNLSVVPTKPAPTFLPHARMTATASSAHEVNDGGHSYQAPHAIDDELWSLWRSEYSPFAALPQSLTLDLGKTLAVQGITYTPSVTAGVAPINGYRVQTSTDGSAYRTVAEGYWQNSHATKAIGFPKTNARFVRLVATDVQGCPATASVAELSVATSPVPTLGAGEPGPGSEPPFSRVVPKAAMSATATAAQPGYGPEKAIDGNCATLWHTTFGGVDPAPQSITLDLAEPYDTVGLAYLPRQDGNTNGIITSYTIEASSDGTTFSPVSQGAWALDGSLKVARWPATGARYLRLTGVDGGGHFVSAAELEVGATP